MNLNTHRNEVQVYDGQVKVCDYTHHHLWVLVDDEVQVYVFELLSRQ
jgi:hypothetical protein